MSRERTLITEVVTGLGTIGRLQLDEALNFDLPPAELFGVGFEDWARLQELQNDPGYRSDFTSAYEAGRYFLEAEGGLRGRSPLRVEWKGKHRSPEHDPLPVDLRIDHVFAVSCKYLSKILLNPSPLALFRFALREGAESGRDWFYESAPEAYQELLVSTCRFLGIGEVPRTPMELSEQQRRLLKDGFRNWPEELSPVVQEFVAQVSMRSAESLNQALPNTRARERFYWKILRIHSAPYFVLGAQKSGPMYARVMTPWDFRRRFKFQDLEVYPKERGQPEVGWRAFIIDQESENEMVIDGHFEIRWSHGRFNKAPEGKVYLDTPHLQTAGYDAL